MTAVQWLRLVMFCVFAATFVVCIVRVCRTKDPVARVGNVATGWMARRVAG